MSRVTSTPQPLNHSVGAAFRRVCRLSALRYSIEIVLQAVYAIEDLLCRNDHLFVSCCTVDDANIIPYLHTFRGLP